MPAAWSGLRYLSAIVTCAPASDQARLGQRDDRLAANGRDHHERQRLGEHRCDWRRSGSPRQSGMPALPVMRWCLELRAEGAIGGVGSLFSTTPSARMERRIDDDARPIDPVGRPGNCANSSSCQPVPGPGYLPGGAAAASNSSPDYRTPSP